MHIYIKKADGSRDLFDEKKLKASLRRSGANKKVIDEIVKEINKVIFDGITTEAIYNMVSKLLRTKTKTAALRYNLTAAIAKLGPEGFAFETFLAEIFKTKGFKNVRNGVKIKGRCMVHELDVVGENKNQILNVEAKFHNSRSKKSDLQVILYMRARFDDILKGGYYGEKKPVQVIITNTKFTDNAKKYAKCSGTEILSWNYPLKYNLHDFILGSGVHPIAALQSIPQNILNKFNEKKIVTIRQIAKDDFQALKNCKFLSNRDYQKIVEEIKEYFSEKI